MGELTTISILGTITAILFSVIMFFLKQLMNKVDIMYDSVVAQKEINRTLFANIERLENTISRINN